MPAFPDPYAHDTTTSDRDVIAYLPKRRGLRLLGLQLAVLVVFSIIWAAFDLDRAVARLFYSVDGGWYLARKAPWKWLHHYGTIPGLVLTLGALVTWGSAALVRRLKPLRRPCMVVALTSILAAGLLTNAVLKQYWGRPRPDQTIEFGGRWQYQHIIPPGTPGKGASFPCGHCTMGYIFLAMWAFRKHNKNLAYGGVGVGIALGVLLSVARVVQGAHFVSDTVWSLGIITMTATSLFMIPPQHWPKAARSGTSALLHPRRLWVPVVIFIAAGLIGTGFLTRRPYYKSWDFEVDLKPQIERIDIQINADPERVELRYKERAKARLQVDVHGFGWIKFDFRMHYDAKLDASSLRLILDSDARSYFAELDHSLTLTLPEEAKDRIQVYFRDTAPEVKIIEVLPSSSSAKTISETIEFCEYSSGVRGRKI